MDRRSVAREIGEPGAFWSRTNVSGLWVELIGVNRHGTLTPALPHRECYRRSPAMTGAVPANRVAGVPTKHSQRQSANPPPQKRTARKPQRKRADWHWSNH